MTSAPERRDQEPVPQQVDRQPLLANAVRIAIDAACAAVALLLAYGAFDEIRKHLGGRPLSASTDIIGYNTFHDFNASEYLRTFYVGAVGAPCVAIVIFAGLRWLIGRAVPAWRWSDRPLLPVPRHQVRPEQSRVGISARWQTNAARAVVAIAAPAFAMGLGLAMNRGPQRMNFWAAVTLGAAAYGCAVVAVTAVLVVFRARVSLIQRVAASRLEALSLVNALGACLALLDIWLAARATSVTAGDGAVHHYLWLPLGAVMALCAVPVAIMVTALIRHPESPGMALLIERRVIMIVGLPTVAYLLFMHLWPAGAGFGLFEQGQQLATVRFVQQGMVPWRDFISDHGLFEDTLRWWPGTAIVEDTGWGMAATEGLMVMPLYYAVLTVFAYRVSSSAMFTLATMAFFFHPNAVPPHLRFLLWPVLLVVLWMAVQSPARWPRPLLGFLMVAFTVIVPEAAFCAVAAGAALVLADLYRADLRRGHRLRSFTCSAEMALGAVATLIVLLIILIALGALRGFVLYFQVAAGDHSITGAIPLLPFEPPYSTWAVLPAVAVVLAILVIAVKVKLRVVLGSEDFVMIAAAALTVAYYQKFTSRADLHVVHVYASAVPLFILVAHQLVAGAATIAGRVAAATTTRRQPLGLYGLAAALALAVAVATAPGSIRAGVRATGTSLMTQTAMTSESPQLGWLQIPQPETADVQAVLARYLRPGDVMYDFTNEPGLYHLILGYASGARYYSIGSAYTGRGQRDVIADLTRTRPRLIVMYGDGGLPMWDDVINEVRSYDVSQWILDRYHPLAAVGGNLFYGDNSQTFPDGPTLASTLKLQEPLITARLSFHLPECAWGYAPAFLDIPHPDASRTVQVSTPASESELTIRPPTGASWSDYHWLEIRTAGPTLSTDSYMLRDGPDDPGGSHAITFRTLDSRSSTYLFPVAACPQWHGYGRAALELSRSGTEPITVSLLP